MPYGYGSRSRLGVQNDSGTRYTPQADSRVRADYGIQAGAFRRHEFTSDTTTALALNDYIPLELLKFVRPAQVPTASNNYQNIACENGSRMSDYKSTIKIHGHLIADPVIIDIYEVQLSFFDAFVWNNFQLANSPVQQAGIAPGPNDLEVSNKAMVGTLINPNSIANFKFVSHFIKHRGEFTIGTDGSSITEQTLIINDIPEKCRRSNAGMFWCLYFKYSSLKNTTTPINLRISREVSFIEQSIARGDQIPALY